MSESSLPRNVNQTDPAGEAHILYSLPTPSPLCYTNSAPARDVEVQQVLANIAAAEAALNLLPKTPKQHPTPCESGAVRQQIESYITSHKKVFSSVRRLPADVLREIFSYFAQPLNLHRNDAYPWRLGQISSDWRSAAFSVGALWSNFHIPKHKEESHNLGHKLGLLLSRGAEHPLSFQVDGDLCDISSVMDVLFQYTRFWGKAEFRQLKNPSTFGSWDSQSDFSRLESLSFASCIIPQNRKDVFQKAPRLTSLRFEHMKDPQDQLSLPWNQITNLGLNMTSSSLNTGSLNLLTLVPHLVELDISISEKGLSSIDAFLPALRTLKCTGTGPNLIRILDSLTTPSLTNLQMCLIGTYYVQEMREAADNFFKRSSCSITQLSISDHANILASHLVEMSPNLISVNILAGRYYPLMAICPLLTVKNNELRTPPFPDLEELSIGFISSTYSEHILELVEMEKALIDSRTMLIEKRNVLFAGKPDPYGCPYSQAAKLHKVNLHFDLEISDYEDPQIVKALESLQSEFPFVHVTVDRFDD